MCVYVTNIPCWFKKKYFYFHSIQYWRCVIFNPFLSSSAVRKSEIPSPKDIAANPQSPLQPQSGPSSSLINVSFSRDALEPGKWPLIINREEKKSLFSPSLSWEEGRLKYLSCNLVPQCFTSQLQTYRLFGMNKRRGLGVLCSLRSPSCRALEEPPSGESSAFKTKAFLSECGSEQQRESLVKL